MTLGGVYQGKILALDFFDIYYLTQNLKSNLQCIHLGQRPPSAERIVQIRRQQSFSENRILRLENSRKKRKRVCCSSRTLKRTPNCSRLETGGNVNRGISSLRRTHWQRLHTISGVWQQRILKHTRAVCCPHILSRIYKCVQEPGCQEVGEDGESSAGFLRASPTGRPSADPRHQGRKPHLAPFLRKLLLSPFTAFSQVS